MEEVSFRIIRNGAVSWATKDLFIKLEVFHNIFMEEDSNNSYIHQAAMLELDSHPRTQWGVVHRSMQGKVWLQIPSGSAGDVISTPDRVEEGVLRGRGNGGRGRNPFGGGHLNQRPTGRGTLNVPPVIPPPVVPEQQPVPQELAKTMTDNSKAAGKRKVGDVVESSKDAATEVGEGHKEMEVDKVKKKDRCFRCRTRGHVSAECKTELFCNVCESQEHVAATCPIKRKPNLII